MQTVASEHRYPQPLVRRIVSRLLAVGLALAAISIAAESILALIVSPLMCGIALFTAILSIAPMLWATGVGAEVIRPMAAPVPITPTI